ncbi:MAG TPA: hypothetical protein DCM14_08805 [Clostridiales bacterium UBA8153]|nr:hypothetical protein [Clostridiales bacterium UBA8153]
MDPDTLAMRCPRLGCAVPFSYCRICGEGERPCFKVLDCWWERFNVTGYFKQRLSHAAFERLAAALPPGKVASLVEMIRQAQQRLKQ